MKFSLRLLLLLSPVCAFCVEPASKPDTSTSESPEKPIDFNRDIRPILSDKCFFCHGPDSHERKADLRLDTAEGALADLGGYAAIVPGKPDKSEFVFRLTDPDDPMPPEDSHKELEPEEIALLTRWIEEGAAYSEPWAYVPPGKRTVPEVQNESWPSNWIDRFVLSRLDGVVVNAGANLVILIIPAIPDDRVITGLTVLVQESPHLPAGRIEDTDLDVLG